MDEFAFNAIKNAIENGRYEEARAMTAYNAFRAADRQAEALERIAGSLEHLADIDERLRLIEVNMEPAIGNRLHRIAAALEKLADGDEVESSTKIWGQQ